MTRYAIIAFLVLCFGGCRVNPLSPQLDQNIQGQIDEIKNNQQGIMVEMGKLRIQADTVEDLQQGLINLNTRLSTNENSGVQILQGDGALMFIFGITVIGMLLYHFRTSAQRNLKVAQIMAQEVAKYNDIELDNNIFRAASNTDVESDILKIMVKGQKDTGIAPLKAQMFGVKIKA